LSKGLKILTIKSIKTQAKPRKMKKKVVIVELSLIRIIFAKELLVVNKKNPQ
jgi:hypothetical protein